jgi:hypothetical protein
MPNPKDLPTSLDPKTLRSYTSEIDQILYAENKRPLVILNGDILGEGVCLGCVDIPCIKKPAEELQLNGVLSHFPSDPNLDVCPTLAITWDIIEKVAVVDPNMCIGCGLCVIRCPFGAINLNVDLIATVHKDDPNNLINESLRVSSQYLPVKQGVMTSVNPVLARNLPSLLRTLSDRHSTLFIRNILFELGLLINTRRKGDTNMRIDAVSYYNANKVMVIEIEYGKSVLESPRALLEDVAIMHSRYLVPVSNIIPVSILLELPNSRSEYYQVINDINDVLDLKCITITIGLLLILLWNFKKFDELSLDNLTLNQEKIDLTCLMESFLIDTIEPYIGAFKPAK